MHPIQCTITNANSSIPHENEINSPLFPVSSFPSLMIRIALSAIRIFTPYCMRAVSHINNHFQILIYTRFKNFAFTETPLSLMEYFYL